MKENSENKRELLEIRTRYTCPECGSRIWEVVQYGDEEPVTECLGCGRSPNVIDVKL